MALGAALGAAVAMPLAQVMSPTSTQVLALTGGAFWGTWFAAWSVALTEVAEPTGLRLTLAASDVGLATAALLVSPLLNVDARRIGVANLGGLAGAGLASLAAALATRNNDAVITANLIGSGAGLIGGAILASSLTLSPVPAAAAASPRVAARSTWGQLMAGVAPPQLVPLIVPDHLRGGGATTMGMGLAFAEAREPVRPLPP
jgi:hypothetical protein